MDVLVVGGGIQGLATACALARDGHAVELLEREKTGSRASWLAAGLLTPSTPWTYPRALVDLAFTSEARFADFVADLIDHGGPDPELEDHGMLYPSGFGVTPEQVADETEIRRELGYEVDLLDRAALDALQPGLGGRVTCAGWQAKGARVRPPRLLAALRRRALALDVVIHENCAVTGLLGGPGGVRGVAACRDGGREQMLEGDAVVLAAGAWSGGLARTLGVDVAVRPVRGQILLLRGPPGLLGPTLNAGTNYLVPRPDGRILVGSTMEEAGFDATTTRSALDTLRTVAHELLPATRDMAEEMSWAGLRPGTPDRMPYIGAVPDVPGLVLATGHFRNGILLAPITAACVAAVLAGRAPPVDLSPFAPRPVDPDAVLAMG